MLAGVIGVPRTIFAADKGACAPGVRAVGNERCDGGGVRELRPDYDPNDYREKDSRSDEDSSPDSDKDSPHSAKHKGPAVLFEASLGAMFLDPRNRTLNGSFGRYESSSFSYSGNLVGHALSVGTLGLRLETPFNEWLYAGIEADLGFGGTSLPGSDMDGYSIEDTRGASLSLGGAGLLFMGLRVPLGYVSMRFESAFGVRAIATRQTTVDPYGYERAAMVGLTVWSVEPHALFDIWLTPRVTLSGFGGINAFHYVDRFGGIALGFHGQKYDGGFLW
jgi:hypothetical protein